MFIHDIVYYITQLLSKQERMIDDLHYLSCAPGPSHDVEITCGVVMKCKLLLIHRRFCECMIILFLAASELIHSYHHHHLLLLLLLQLHPHQNGLKVPVYKH